MTYFLEGHVNEYIARCRNLRFFLGALCLDSSLLILGGITIMSNYHFTLKSRNAKTGAIPTTVTSADTCPDACPLKVKGCYAKGGPLAMHWRAVTEGQRGSTLDALCDDIMALPEGTLWRHNVAGDLPGHGDTIDKGAMLALISANEGKRGFTYTHKPAFGANGDLLRFANAKGFTVNLSANTLAHADQLAALNIGPVVVVQDAIEGTRADTTTPEGRKVATCPATYRDDVTCASCGLCAVRDRKVIVGFPAHGAAKRAAATIAKG